MSVRDLRVPDRVGQRSLDHLARVVRLLGGPVAEGGAEAVWDLRGSPPASAASTTPCRSAAGPAPSGTRAGSLRRRAPARRARRAGRGARAAPSCVRREWSTRRRPDPGWITAPHAPRPEARRSGARWGERLGRGRGQRDLRGPIETGARAHREDRACARRPDSSRIPRRRHGRPPARLRDLLPTGKGGRGMLMRRGSRTRISATTPTPGRTARRRCGSPGRRVAFLTPRPRRW